MKMTVFWDVAKCSVVETGGRFRHVLMMEIETLMKRRSISTKLCGSTVQKTIVFISIQNISKTNKRSQALSASNLQISCTTHNYLSTAGTVY
jgi:hypothetical protein